MVTESNNSADKATSHEGQHPTRSATLIAHAHAYIHETGTSVATFSQHIASIYNAQVAADHQTLSLPPAPPEDAKDAYEAYAQWRDKLKKKAMRWLSGDVSIPVDIEDAWVAALPDPYRARCISDLCARMGRLAVEVPEQEACVVSAGKVMKEAGEAVTAIGELQADGVIDEHDLPNIPDARRECREAAAAALACEQRLAKDELRIREEQQEPLKAVK